MDGSDLRALRTKHGLTQTEVARAARMHQPDLSALENGRLTSDALLTRVEGAIRSLLRPGATLQRHRDEVRTLLESMGAQRVRVFGSTIHGTDKPGSDVDLLVDAPEGTGLITVIRMEEAVRAVLDVPVDIVVDDPATPALATARAEAVPL